MQSETTKIEKKINYYYELNKFYNEFLPLNKLTPNQIALYHAILFIANRANKYSNIPIPIITLKQNTGMEKDALLTARKALQTKGLITFKQFGGCVATEYSLKPFGRKGEEKEQQKEKIIKGKKRTYIGREYKQGSLENTYTDLDDVKL